MPPKEIYLHIGRGKTGTTSIQEFCAKNREFLSLRGIHYIQAGEFAGGGHQTFAKSLLVELPSWMEPDPNVEGIQSVVRDELLKSTANTFLISSENLTLVAPSVCKAYFSQIFADVRIYIIFFARSQDELVESQYNQSVKWTREILEFDAYLAEDRCEELDFDALLEPWAATFGRQNIIAKIYDASSASVIAQFLSCFPIDLMPQNLLARDVPPASSGDFSNASIGFRVLEIFRFLNNFDLPGRREIYRSIHIALRPNDTPALFFSSSRAREFRKRFWPSNQRFAAKYLNRELDELGGCRHSPEARDAILLAREKSLTRAMPGFTDCFVRRT